MAEEKKSSNINAYKATDGYKAIMSNKGLLSEAQHKKLLKGEAADLKNVPEKQMRYLLINKLIEKS